MTPSQWLNAISQLFAFGVLVAVLFNPSHAPVNVLLGVVSALVPIAGSCRSTISRNAGNVPGGLPTGPDLKAVTKTDGVQ